LLKYITVLKYEIVQGSTGQLSISLPAAQALTKLHGEGFAIGRSNRTGSRP